MKASDEQYIYFVWSLTVLPRPPQACSNIYFTLDALHQIHFLYQYSLHFFLDVFTDVLSNNPNIKDQTDYSRRLSIITNDLFQVRGGTDTRLKLCGNRFSA